MNSKDIENKIKALYEDVEPDHFEADDKTILSYEKRGIEYSERYKNDPKFRQHIQNALDSRDDIWLQKVTEHAKELAKKHSDIEWKAEWSKRHQHARDIMKDRNGKWYKDISARNKEMAKDPKWQKAHKKSRAPISDKDSDWYKRIVKANKIRAKKQKDPSTQEYKNMRKGREKMMSDPHWKLTMCKNKGGLPVSTPWDKLYMSCNDASKDSANHGDFYSSKKIRIRSTKGIDGFKFITWEEYESTMIDKKD